MIIFSVNFAGAQEILWILYPASVWTICYTGCYKKSYKILTRMQLTCLTSNNLLDALFLELDLQPEISSFKISSELSKTLPWIKGFLLSGKWNKYWFTTSSRLEYNLGLQLAQIKSSLWQKFWESSFKINRFSGTFCLNRKEGFFMVLWKIPVKLYSHVPSYPRTMDHALKCLTLLLKSTWLLKIF